MKHPVGWRMATDRQSQDFRKRIADTHTQTLQDKFDQDVYGDWQGRLVERELERRKTKGNDAHRRAEGNRSAAMVGHADNANRLAKEANKVSREANRVAVAAFILAAVALALSLGLFF